MSEREEGGKVINLDSSRRRKQIPRRSYAGGGEIVLTPYAITEKEQAMVEAILALGENIEASIALKEKAEIANQAKAAERDWYPCSPELKKLLDELDDRIDELWGQVDPRRRPIIQQWIRDTRDTSQSPDGSLIA